jgi:molybdopterin converting factor small subunit
MRITIHYMGQVKHAAGVASHEEVDLPDDCSVLECIRQLAERTDDRLRHFLLDSQGQVNRTILLFAGEEQVRDAERVKLYDGDVLTVLSPIAGGTEHEPL